VAVDVHPPGPTQSKYVSVPGGVELADAMPPRTAAATIAVANTVVATIPAENLERFIVVKPLFQSRGVTDHAWQPFE
jgi:hypothetical protein